MASCSSTLGYMVPHFLTGLWSEHSHIQTSFTLVGQFLDSAVLLIYSFTPVPLQFWWLYLHKKSWYMADVTKTGSSFATPLFSCFLWPQLGSMSQSPFYKALLQVGGWILTSDVSWKQYILFLLLLIKPPMHDPSFALSPSANIYSLMQTYMITLKNESQMEDAWF